MPNFIAVGMMPFSSIPTCLKPLALLIQLKHEELATIEKYHPLICKGQCLLTHLSVNSKDSEFLAQRITETARITHASSEVVSMKLSHVIYFPSSPRKCEDINLYCEEFSEKVEVPRRLARFIESQQLCISLVHMREKLRLNV